MALMTLDDVFGPRDRLPTTGGTTMMTGDSLLPPIVDEEEALVRMAEEAWTIPGTILIPWTNLEINPNGGETLTTTMAMIGELPEVGLRQGNDTIPLTTMVVAGMLPVTVRGGTNVAEVVVVEEAAEAVGVEAEVGAAGEEGEGIFRKMAVVAETNSKRGEVRTRRHPRVPSI